MIPAAIAFPLAAYAAFVLWRIRVEDGWVGFEQPKTPLQVALLRLRWGIACMERLLGEAFLGAVRSTTEAFARWNDAMKAAAE